MSEPTAALQAMRASTADLLKGLDEQGWADEDLRVASLCPGWTRGHVLTHLARNADGIATTLAGALRGEIVPKYPAGTRDEDVEAGSARSLAAIQADLAESAERLDRVFGAVTEANAWDALTEGEEPAAAWAPRRLFEVEVHRVDLAGAYGPDRWPPALIQEWLPALASAARGEVALQLVVAASGSVVPSLVGQEWTSGSGDAVLVEAPDWALLAWLAGRGAAVRDALPDPPALAQPSS